MKDCYSCPYLKSTYTGPDLIRADFGRRDVKITCLCELSQELWKVLRRKDLKGCIHINCPLQ